MHALNAMHRLHYPPVWLDYPHRDPAAADDVKMARLMVMGAINFTVTWYKQPDEKRKGGPTAAQAMDLDALADRTVRFFMQVDND